VRKAIFLLLLAVTGGCKQEPARVFYINSYHRGFHSSDETMAGIKETFKEQNIDLRISIMDTKRNPQVEFIEAKAEEVIAEQKIMFIASNNE